MNLEESSTEPVPTALSKEPTDFVPVDERKWTLVEKEKLQELAHREKAVRFILRVYAGVLIITFSIIILQGFSIAGFKLDQAFLNWLGGATITEVAAIAGLVFRAIFGRDPDRSAESKKLPTQKPPEPQPPAAVRRRKPAKTQTLP